MITTKMRVQSLLEGLAKMREDEGRLENVLGYAIPNVELRKLLLLEAETKLDYAISRYTDVHNAIERREEEINTILQQEVNKLLASLSPDGAPRAAQVYTDQSHNV